MSKRNRTKRNIIVRNIIFLIIGVIITQLGNMTYDCITNQRTKKSYNKTLAIALESVGNEIGSNQMVIESSKTDLLMALHVRGRVMIFKQLDYSEWENKRQIIENSESLLEIAVLNNVQVIYRLFYACEGIIDDYKEWQNKIDEFERNGVSKKATDKFREEITNKTVKNLENLLNDISARVEYISHAWNSRRDELYPYLNRSFHYTYR